MQCEIRGMADIAEAGRPPPDTMPKRGRVNEVCREWLVHEDGALAYKLQKEEVEQHYTGNKSRNAVVRQDTPLAKSEQQREEEEALAKYHQRILEQEQYDAQVARQIAARLEREEQQRRMHREQQGQQDEEIARHLQVRSPAMPAMPAMPAPGPGALAVAVASTRVERERVKLEKERRERERLDAEFAYQHQHPPPLAALQHQKQHWQMPPPSRSPAQLPPLSHSHPQHPGQASPPAPAPAHAQPLPPRQPKPGPSSGCPSPLYNPPPPVTNVRAYPKPSAGHAGHAGHAGPAPGSASGAVASTSASTSASLLPDEPYGQDVAGAVGGAGATCFAHTPPRAARQPHGLGMAHGARGPPGHGLGHMDVNAIGLPCEDMAQQIRQLNLSRHTPSQQMCDDFPTAEDLFEEEARRVQEEKDAELARQLQEQEEREGAEGIDRDRLLAMEAQDQELARMLQEKEKAKLRRARERAKQKALLKRQQEQHQQGDGAGPSGSGSGTSSPMSPHHPIAAEDEEGCYSLPHQGSPTPPAPAPEPLNRSAVPKGRRRFPDPEAIEELPSPTVTPPGSVSGSGGNDALRNIAIVIDPTYPRRSPPNAADIRSSPVTTVSQQDFPEEDCASPAPPYMPIQGQRRTASLEKKSKKKAPKDGCKQQ